MEIRLRNMATVYITKGERILLLYRQGGRVVNNVWVGSAGGHFEQTELNDPRACVLRELQEETGLTAQSLAGMRLRYVTLRYCHGEIRQNYYYFAELRENVPEDIISAEGQLRWFPLSELAALEMPLSARNMIDHYLSVGHCTDTLYCGAASAGHAVFTELPET